MKVYVVDASVARFLLVEELSDKAERLLQRFHDERTARIALGGEQRSARIME